jgi:DNA-3-methyladenine glycosylase II
MALHPTLLFLFPVETMPNKAFDFLCACDPTIGAVVERFGPLEERVAGGDHFAALCDIIIGQQLSVASARAIKNRFRAHFGEAPEPAKILEMTGEVAKSLGLSGQKARYLQNLAKHIEDGQLDMAHLETLSDDEIRADITAVKGLGPWSADIFLMFHLNRPDVLPVGDLGIREAIRQLYDLEARPEAGEMERISAPWRPYRTLASLYLWRFLDEK